MSDDVKDTEPPKQKPRYATVMVGHCVDNETDEAMVVLYSAGGNRLSIAGARILAAQIAQWADHAEKRNAERPKESIARFMYRVLDDAKQWQHVDNVAMAAAPNEGKPGYVRRPYTNEWILEGIEPGIQSATPEEEKVLQSVTDVLETAKKRSQIRKALRGRKLRRSKK